jgi:serine/threonine-protein kinase
MMAERVCPRCGASPEDAETRFCGRCGASFDAPRAGAETLIGRVIGGRYRILEKIGQGGMGAVYKVEHLAMGKQAAMKLLHPMFSHESETGARFRREAEAVSRLSHPNTVQVFDFGQDRGFMYLVMELIKGEDLGQILRRDGPIRWPRARAILMQVCDSLAEAHELGIVHRDLKPENLLVSRTRDGRDFVKVLDFGLAKLRDSEELNQVTARGTLVGTPHYMSPEQIRAEPLDARSDIYSLGALLYRMLTGEHPFAGPTPMAVLTQHLTDPLISPSKRRPDLDIDGAVDAIVERAMAKAKEARYASADELRRALEQAPHRSPSAEDHAEALEGKRRETDRIDPASASPLEARLKREDVDEYERGIQKRRWLGRAVIPIVATVVIAGLAWLRPWGGPTAELPSDVEVEPNDTAAQASPIGNDHTVRGHVAGVSDRDFYRFAVERGAHVLHVDLTGIPKLDLRLTVYDPRGQRIAEADALGPGESETLPDLRLDGPGDFYIEVRSAAGETAENARDWYALTARWQPLGPNQEAEPNDTQAQAQPLPLEQAMRGYAGRAGDVDYYYLRGEGGGTVSGELSGIDGVDLKIVVLPSGRVFDSGGPGAAESFDGIPWPAGAPSPIVVVERKDGGLEPAAGSKSRKPLVGLDVPYSLNVRLTR